jgi:hypothetical protein
VPAITAPPLPTVAPQASSFEALLDAQLLRFTEHALWILASHGVGEGSFPLVCAACQRPWCCPEIVWAADWILKAQQLSFLAASSFHASDDRLVIVAPWGTGAVVPTEVEAVSADG